MLKSIPPSMRRDQYGKCDPHEVYEHPAYGVITLTNPHGGEAVLFGSDIGHNSRLCITIHRANLKRDLSNDWIHPNKTIVEIELSHAQFAEFITGVGNGSGTPCTIRYAPEPGTPVVSVPGIERVETKHQMFRREIHDSAKKTIETFEHEIARLEALIESGKTPKTELRDIARNLRIRAQNAPSNISFVVEQAEEALEKATTAAKIEVEAFIGMKAKQLGLESIQQLAQLEFKSEDAVSGVGDMQEEQQ